jgi:hypothetical protein
VQARKKLESKELVGSPAERKKEKKQKERCLPCLPEIFLAMEGSTDGPVLPLLTALVVAL